MDLNNRKINVAFSGSSGRMGKAILPLIKKDNDFNLVLAFDKNDDYKKMLQDKKIDVLIDFTYFKAANEIIPFFLKKSICVVSGTTAQECYFDEYKSLVEKYNVSLAVIPNFSIGAYLLSKFSIYANRFFEKCEIIESHHITKKDKPSGTARQLANKLSISDIHSLRLSGILAKHEVIFGKSGEILSIIHNTIDRECYYYGIKLTVKKVLNTKGPYFYKSLSEIIE